MSNMKTKKGRGGVSYSYLERDRNLTTSFNEYSDEELIQLRTLMYNIGGAGVVAYELYKLDNKLLDNTRTIVEFNTVSVNNSNNIKILTREEINNLIYKDNNTKIKILHTHVKEVSTRVRYEKSPLLKHSYVKKVHISLNPKKTNKDTIKVIRIINRLANTLSTSKERNSIIVSNLLTPKKNEKITKVQEKEVEIIKKTKEIVNEVEKEIVNEVKKIDFLSDFF